jgi:hypothetical protein
VAIKTSVSNPRDNPLASPLAMGRRVLRPWGRPYPPGLKLKVWNMPNGAQPRPVKKKSS